MAFKFRVLFSGLCAFVRDGEQSMSVLLPNAIRSSLLSVHPDKPMTADHILPPHLPMLRFDTKNLKPCGSLQPHLIFQANDQEDKNGICFMMRQDLAFRPDGREADEPRLRFVRGEPRDVNEPTPEEEKSLFWLTRLDDVLAGVRVDPRLLGMLSNDEKTIIARIRLDGGRLQTEKLSEPKWEYLPVEEVPDEDGGRRVALCLALELQAEQAVKLVFSDFGESGERCLVLGPEPSDPYQDVTIEIQNREPATILPMDDGEVQSGVHIDPDFSIYYRLAHELREGISLPVPQRHVSPGEANIGGFGKPCSPVEIEVGGG